MDTHDTAAIIVKKDNKFLISKRKNPPKKGMWGFPGGHKDKGETIKKCALREASEEIGKVEIKQKLMTFTHDVEINHRHNCHVFTAKLKEKPKAKSDVSKIKWVTLEEMKDEKLMEWALYIINEKFF